MKITFSFLLVLVGFLYFSCDTNLSSINTTNTDPHFASNVFVVSDNISAVTTWLEGKVYYIDEPVSITNGATLTIQPGTIVKFDSEASLNIENGATVIANGSADKPIYFTSIRDTIGGDSITNDAAIGPTKGDWHQVWIQNGSNSNQLAYCHFRYGGKDGKSSLYVDGKGTIDRCFFYYNLGSPSPWTYNNGAALTITEPNQGVTLTNSTFYENYWPLSLPASMNIDDSNSFSYDHDKDANTIELTNTFQGIWMNTIVNPAYLISTAVSWNEPEVPFCLFDDLIYIQNGGSLTIASNGAVKCSGIEAGFKIEYGGTFNNTNSTLFTSYKNDTVMGDTNHDETATSPSDGDWYGIEDLTTDPSSYRTGTNITYAANGN